MGVDGPSSASMTVESGNSTTTVSAWLSTRRLSGGTGWAEGRGAAGDGFAGGWMKCGLYSRVDVYVCDNSGARIHRGALTSTVWYHRSGPDA
jgi:hypothetical protein